MSRTRQVLWASALSGASVFVSMAAAFVVLKLASKHLSIPDFGVFLLIRVWADGLNLFANLGLAASLPRVIAATPQKDRAFTVATALTGTAALSGGLAIGLWTLWWGTSGSLEIAMGEDNARFLGYAWLVPPLFFVGVLRDTAMAALAGLQRFVHRAASIVIASLLTVGIAVLCIWTGHVSVASFSGAMALGHGLNLLWLYAALPPDARWRIDRARFARIARDSIALYNNNLLNFVYQRVDTLIAQRYLGLEAVSMLGVAKQFPTTLSQVMGALLVPLLPNLAELTVQGDRATASRVLNRAALLAACLGYTATLAAIAFARPLLLLITTEHYTAAAPLLGWLMAAMALAIQAGIMGQGLIALGRASNVTAVNTVTAMLALGLNLLLLPRYGFLAAGYTALLAIVFSAVAQAVLVDRGGLTVQWRPWLGVQVLFCVLVVAPLLFPVPGAAPLAGLAFLPLCLLTRALPWEDLTALLNALRKR